MRTVQFVDLKPQYLELKSEIDHVVRSVIDDSAFIRGPHVQEFEENFAKIIGSSYAVSCGNGTDALFLALKALGVSYGDEVIVPAHSWISTSQVVSMAGAKVVFCDTEPENHTIDTSKLEQLINERTVGIIPVHLFGHCANMEKITKVAKSKNLWIIEDCAQAHLAKFKNQTVGKIGDFGCFSFYPGKNLGAMGDGGCVVTNNKSLRDRVTRLARHGGLYKGEHLIEGMNSRLDTIQAGVLNAKLQKIKEWTEKRRTIADLYGQYLQNVPQIKLPTERAYAYHVWHLYVVEVLQGDREELRQFLSRNGISTLVNYPTCLPMLPAYKNLNPISQNYSNAIRAQSAILSLPMYAHISHSDIEYVCDKIKTFFKVI